MKKTDISQFYDFMWTDDLLPVPASLASKVEELFKVNDDLSRHLSMDQRRHWVEFRFHQAADGIWMASVLPRIEALKWTASQAYILLQGVDAFNRRQSC
ncbi:hypothetical protein J2857_006188 [Neorhizobium galegae]|uniref:hypothetical protein n=1 Tax=Neorhizobium galegae TaxID=399 RepID=UPI001AEAB2A9|nr:hypothetical protein [Neorhizobium galegae]MBP2563389.1 hypothetical protein [Neorhizobium galegae]